MSKLTNPQPTDEGQSWIGGYLAYSIHDRLDVAILRHNRAHKLRGREKLTKKKVVEQAVLKWLHEQESRVKQKTPSE